MNGIAWYTLEGDSKICDYKIRRNVMSIITIYIETLNHNFDFNKVISRNLENLLSQARIDCQIKGWTMPELATWLASICGGWQRGCLLSSCCWWWSPWCRGSSPSVSTTRNLWNRTSRGRGGGGGRCNFNTSAVKRSIGFTIRFHNHGEGPSRGLLRNCDNGLWNRWIVLQH